MNENPLTHNSMKQDGAAGRRKALMTAGAIALALVAVASIAFSVYAWQQNRQLTADLATKNNQIADLQKQKSGQTTPAPSATTTPATDPYTGWKSATLKYEKATFKYPSTWTVTNVSTPNGTTGNITPGSDQITLTSTTGLTLKFSTGVSGIGGGPYFGTVLSTTPIATLGGNYYLGFGTNGADSHSTSASAGHIGTASTSQANFISSKNVTSTGGQAYDVISLAYFDASGSAIDKPVSAFQSDTSYSDALLIIKPLSY